MDTERLMQENLELKRRLQEEESKYEKRIDTYRQAQQHQAALVSKLQAKVLQYKKRCSDLEMQTSLPGDLAKEPVAAASPLEAAQAHLRSVQIEQIKDLETALHQLGRERERCERLIELNSALQKQLEEANSTNEALTNDLQSLTTDWQKMREDMLEKEEEWKEEEQFFNEYYMTEQNRVLNLWKDIVSMKRTFAEIQSATQRDLNKLRNEVTSTTSDVVAMCSGLVGEPKKSSVTQGDGTAKEKVELEKKLTEAYKQREEFLQQLKQKDNKIESLSSDIKKLNAKIEEMDKTCKASSIVQEGVEVLLNGLKEIAQTVVLDADTKNATEDIHPVPHIHLTSVVSSTRSPFHENSSKLSDVSAFVETTISGVHAALNKYKSQIHELQVKFASQIEQLAAAEKQCENYRDVNQKFGGKVAELEEELDSLKAELDVLAQERNSLTKVIDAAREEAAEISKQRTELNKALEKVSSNYEKMSQSNSKLQKIALSLEEEKNFLQNELERLSNELDTREANSRMIEDRYGEMLKELLTIKEELNKACLDKELVEQHRAEAQSLLRFTEKTKGDIELELQKVLLERSEVNDALAKADHRAQTLLDDKMKLQEELTKAKNEKTDYQNQLTELNNDLDAIRKELLLTEQCRLELENEKISLQEKCRNLETDKNKVDAELAKVSNEKSDLSNQLMNIQRKKDTLNEELIKLRQRIEQVSDTNCKINRHLENLVTDCEEKQIMLETSEKEIANLQELNILLKNEKDHIESILTETQTSLEASEIKRDELEKDYQELLSKEENLKNDLKHLEEELEKSKQQNNDTKAKLLRNIQQIESKNAELVDDLKKQNEEIAKKLNTEKGQIRTDLEELMKRSVAKVEEEKEAEIASLQKTIDSLKQHMEMQCQQHEESLRRAENDKQQALLIAHQDQKALTEKLQTVYNELENEKAVHEKTKRESSAKVEQDRNALNAFRNQITKITAKMDDMRIKTENEKHRLENEIENLRKERDDRLKECDDLKVQLNLAEERTESVKAQLLETANKLKEGERSVENVRKELNSVKRHLNESNIEKEKYFNTNEDLRDLVKKSEAERREQARLIEESNQKISSLEETASQLENERNRLQGMCREVETKLLQSDQKCQNLQQELDKADLTIADKQNEQKELLVKLNLEIEDKEKAEHDLHNYKKQLLETEANLDIYQQEVNKLRHLARESEDRWHYQEAELLSRLEDSQTKGRKLQDEKYNLEVCLTDSTQQIQELKAKLSGTEGRVRILENQLSQMESGKKNLEKRLRSIGTLFKQLPEIADAALPFRTRSVARRWSPSRAKSVQFTDDSGPEDSTLEATGDVDLDYVRRNVRALVQQIAQTERERDDLKAQISGMKKQLEECEQSEKRNENKINSLLNTLRQANEEKGSLEARLGQKENELISEVRASDQLKSVNRQLQEKITVLENNVRTVTDEKSQLEAKLAKARAANADLENGKQKLKEELSKLEGKASKLDIQHISLEGDVNRLKMAVEEKDTTIQKLQSRIETQSSNVAELEERCVSLKSTVEQLHATLEFSSANENELRAEIQNLHKCLTECSSSTEAYEEKLKQLQKSCTTAEAECKMLTERLERTNATVYNLQTECSARDEQICRLQLELDSKELEIASLQDQLRMSCFTVAPETETKEAMYKLQSECSELRAKNQILDEKVRHLEAEKRKLMVIRSRAYDKAGTVESLEAASATSIATGLNMSVLQQEIRDLKEKCNKQEIQLIEKEAQLAKLRARDFSRSSAERSDELEKYRAGQLHAEHLLKAREQSHRQQVERLKNEISNLRKRLDQEIKFRKKYLLESIDESQNVRQLRDTLASSLRTVSEHPSLDALLLDHEIKKLDNSVILAKSPAQSRLGKRK